MIPRQSVAQGIITLCLITTIGFASNANDTAQTRDPLQKTRFSFREVAMGCEMRIELFAEDSTQAQNLARAAFDRVHALDDVLSDYRATSEVGRLAMRPETSILISRDLADAVRRSLLISQATDGLFDAAIGASTQLWRNARKNGVIPDDNAIAQANSQGGWHAITLSFDAKSDGPLLTFSHPGLRLDFGGIGKGLAAQSVLEKLRSLGASSAMCAVAGDIACGDPPPGTNGWTINVVSGLDGVPSCELLLHNQCVSTSGDESQHLDANGTRYSHVLDPRTGHAVTRRIAATVISCNGAIADGLATALCVGGPELLARSADLRTALGDFQARVAEITPTQQLSPAISVTSGWNAIVASTNSRHDQASPLAPAVADQTATKAASDSSDLKAPHPK